MTTEPSHHAPVTQPHAPTERDVIAHRLFGTTGLMMNQAQDVADRLLAALKEAGYRVVREEPSDG